LLNYGFSNFSLDILEYCKPSILISREQYYIDLLKPWYNICKIAGSNLGFKHSEMTKAKLSINNTGVNHPFFGKRHTYESIKKIEESLKSKFRFNDSPKIIKLDTRLKLYLRSHGVSVKVFDKSNKLVNEFPTIISAAKHFGISIIIIFRYKYIYITVFPLKLVLKEINIFHGLKPSRLGVFFG